MEEIWKDIYFIENGIEYDYRGKYQVSNLGNVRSVNYNHTGKIRVLKQFKDNSGYLVINLHNNGKQKQFLVHRLVAIVFLENSDNSLVVNHINFNRADNRVCNLEFVTQQENIQHAWNDKERADIHRHKLSEAKNKSKKKVICVETKQIFSSLSDASKQYGTNRGNISNCCRNRNKTAGGYHWKYIEEEKELD